jgi:phosphoribosylformylglycinamidine synthase subunit PurL
MQVTPEVLAEVALTQSEYDLIVEKLGREPSPVELGMFGAMWSEHCGYKNSRPILKRFPTSGEHVLQGPGENAGAVDIGDGLAAVFKIESHNHPSAVEPYQGAATGVGGIVRDIFTMGARPTALLNSLRFGPLTEPRNQYLFSGVVGGIGGYGNCLGIPTVSGDIFFHSSYSGNPLVNAMCVGIARQDQITTAEASGVGNLVVLVGADTGRDGIQGATFASVVNPEESHRGVIQVGNPFLEKLLIEACLELLQTPHVVAMQDLGAAGLTSSAVECASRGTVGIEIDVENVSRREKGMTPYEVMLSESQERMLVVVKPEGLEAVQRIFEYYDLHSDVIGQVTGDGNVRVKSGDTIVADVPARLYTDECPVYVREGVEKQSVVTLREFDLEGVPDLEPANAGEALLQMLRSPNIGSRKPVTQTYDHTILSNTVVAPIKADAAVIRVKGTDSGLAVKTDCNPRYCYLEPFAGGAHAVAEAARNVSCVGAEPLAITNCLNFGNPEDPGVYYQMQQAVEGMSSACEALGIPVISGNVSLYNESGDTAIFPTPTVGIVGRLPDVERHASMGFKGNGVAMLIGEQEAGLGASEYLEEFHNKTAGAPPAIDLEFEVAVQRAVRELISDGVVNVAHDTSEGGLAVALAESCIQGGQGLVADLHVLQEKCGGRIDRTLFGEAASRIVIEVDAADELEVVERLEKHSVPVTRLGDTGGNRMTVSGYIDVEIEQLRKEWSSALTNHSVDPETRQPVPGRSI